MQGIDIPVRTPLRDCRPAPFCSVLPAQGAVCVWLPTISCS